MHAAKFFYHQDKRLFDNWYDMGTIYNVTL